MISKATRLQRQARERRPKAAPAAQAGEVVFMWGHEELVIRSESDLREALRRIGLGAVSEESLRRGPCNEF
jgi:hypothetical protein